MKHKRFTLFVLALSLLFIFSGCRAASEAGEAPAEVAVPAEPTMEVANPAAVYCEEQGFAYEIRTNDDGSQFGVCILADGTECDEWAFFNGDCPAITPAAPAEVVQAFYNWYLDFMSDRSSGDFINPPVGGLYRDSEYLSADFIAQVDADLANMGELGGADPILLAQDIPVRVEVQEANVSAGEATVVLLRYWGGNPDPSPMVVHLRQENGRWLINNITPFEVPETSSVAPQPAVPTADMDPVAVTQAFYDWYLAYIGDPSSGDFRNPLVDKAYHSNPLLTPEFITRVDEILASFEGGGYDPFLLAQDIPKDLFAQSAMIAGSEARVTVLRNWGAPVMDAIFAHLRQMNGIWLIDDITTTELYEPTTETPEGTVQLFYAWYTDALRRRFEDDTVEVDFHDSDLLTDSFKQHLDELRAAAEAEFPELGLGYDPLLCAQDVPYHVTPDQALIDGDTAWLTTRSSFPNHVLVIDLQKTEAGWLISNVACVRSPESTVKAFYTWYLGFMSDRSSDFVNPLVEGLYRDSEHLSANFIAQVEADLANMGELGGVDPILLAQDIPVRMEVQEASVVGDEATVVMLRYWGGNPEPSPMVIHLRQENGRWLISSVSMAEPLPDSAPVGGEQYIFIDRDFGFSFNYPAGWVIEKLDMDGHGQPYDWPVAAGWMIMPPDVADTLAVQRPADPNVPIIVAPFNVEVVLGNEAAVTRVYMELEGETVEFNGVSGVKIGSDYKNYVFAHPYRYETWVVITDWVTEFPGREAQAESLTDVLLPLLNSLTFNETD